MAVRECRCQIWSRWDDSDPMKPSRSRATACDHGSNQENWRTPSGSVAIG